MLGLLFGFGYLNSGLGYGWGGYPYNSWLVRSPGFYGGFGGWGGYGCGWGGYGCGRRRWW